jgi:hypothetical protein
MDVWGGGPSSSANRPTPGRRVRPSLTAPAPACPEHTFHQPVPIVARIVWADDGEEYVETVAAGWTGQLVYARVPDRRYRLTSVWLNAADVKRR